MSDDVKARAQQLLDSITPAPWVWQTNDKGYPQQIVANDDGLVLVAETYTGPEHPAAEAEFIAAAPELVRELLAALETAEAERDQWKVTAYSLDACLGERDEVIADAKNALNLAAAHRFDFDRRLDSDHTEWLATLGEKPKRGPDNFYNGVQFVTRRVRRILAGQS